MIKIGGDIIIFKKDIVGIFDFDEFTSSAEGKEFFRELKKKKKVENADKSKIPQSVILCVDETGSEKYFLSPISISGLRKGQYGENLNADFEFKAWKFQKL